MTASRRWLVAALGAALTIACAISQWNIDLDHRVDFRIYHRAIRSIGSRGLYHYGVGDDLGFTYPPFAAVLLRPITWLPETLSSHVWLLISIALAAAVFWSGLKLIDAGHPLAAHRPIIVGMCMWAYPVFLSFRLGQVNPLVVGLLTLDIVLLSRQRRAGFGTGLAAALKVTPLAMVGFLIVSRPRDGLRALATFLAATAFAALVLPTETRQYWTDKLFDTKRVGHTTGGNNVSLKSVVLEFVPGAHLQTLVWGMGALALLTVAALRIRRTIDADPLGAYVVGMCCSYAVSPITWAHHQWFTVMALLVWILRATQPSHWAVVGLGVVGLLDPFAFGETSMATCTMIVAFLVITIARMPAAPNAPEPDPDPDPGPGQAELAQEPLASPMM